MYRATTLFGKVLFALRVEADRSRRPLHEEEDFRRHGGFSISSTGKGCGFTLIDDAEMLDLARRAHAAFPEIPLLGFDILRDPETGRLFIIEVNTCGQTWHFSSPIEKSMVEDFDIDLYGQFGGMRRAAEILIDQTRLTDRRRRWGWGPDFDPGPKPVRPEISYYGRSFRMKRYLYAELFFGRSTSRVITSTRS